MKEMLQAGVHFGHQSRYWNPKMEPYIFMEKNGIHVIDLNKTVVKLNDALAALKQISKSGRKIMFVATCALLLAAGNALVPPQKAQTLRARPLAAPEGSAAEAAKKRIARSSVFDTVQGRPDFQIYVHNQKNAQRRNIKSPSRRFPPPPNQETHTGRRRQRHGRPAPRRALRRQARGAGRV